jgi:predicted TIM-barrel fold metal-dependent hydrolase
MMLCGCDDVPPRRALGSRPPVDDAIVADELVEPWFSCLLSRVPGLHIFDCHTHFGSDPDGSRLTAGELRRALDVIDARAVVFPLATTGGYRAANDLALAAAEAADGQLVAFCRVDPHTDGSAEVERALKRGAAGIKLHPRAERFLLSDPAVTRIIALANERRVPIIVHAGRGVPSLGRDALDLAQRFPAAPLILAHAAIADLAWIWPAAAAHPNLFFDTAWWNTAGLLALFALVPPGQILFASDTPYGRPVAAAAIALRVALAVGLTGEQTAAVFGGQLTRLLAHQAAHDLGPAQVGTARAPGPLLERLHTLLVAAAARATTAQPAEEYLDLARLACQLPDEHPDAAVSASILDLLDRHARYLATGPEQHGPRPAGIHFIFVAAAIARLPDAPLPTSGAFA